MTIASEPSTEETESAPGGSRVSSWIVLVVMLLALGGGIWFLYTSLAEPRESAEFDVGTISDRYQIFRGGGVAQPRPDINRDGIHAIGGNLYRVQSGDFFMTLAPTETTYAPLRLMVVRREVLTPDSRALVRLCTETANAGFAKTLEITPDQIKQLAPLRQQVSGGMKITDDDRNKLRELWKAWNAAKDPAAKAPAETALLAAVKDVGTRSVEPTKQQYTDLAGQIKKIVTDAQLMKFRQLRGL